jgi:hypothetical protein
VAFLLRTFLFGSACFVRRSNDRPHLGSVSGPGTSDGREVWSLKDDTPKMGKGVVSIRESFAT